MLRPACSWCHSSEVQGDAYVEWNPDKQEWEIVNVYDKGAYCSNCDGETSLDWLDPEIHICKPSAQVELGCAHAANNAVNLLLVPA